MARFDFTSGERRGLIVLLAGLTLLIAVTSLRLCSGTSDPVQTNINGGSAVASVETGDSLMKQTDNTETTQKPVKRKTRAKSAKTTRSSHPDGRQRKHLDDLVDE